MKADGVYGIGIGSFEPFKYSSFVRVKRNGFSVGCFVEKTGGVQTTILQLFNPISGCS
jgi:hypothetical protein